MEVVLTFKDPLRGTLLLFPSIETWLIHNSFQIKCIVLQWFKDICQEFFLLSFLFKTVLDQQPLF